MADQLDLFGHTRPDPGRQKVGRFHSHGTDTERLAAARVAPRSGTQRSKVLAHLRTVGERGSTDYEAGLALSMFRHVAGTRREELIADGWPIIDSGLRRKTDTGNSAIVWRYCAD
jgi:hypothetical protein